MEQACLPPPSRPRLPVSEESPRELYPQADVFVAELRQLVDQLVVPSETEQLHAKVG
jgi:hypothetical protein